MIGYRQIIGVIDRTGNALKNRGKVGALIQVISQVIPGQGPANGQAVTRRSTLSANAVFRLSVYDWFWAVNATVQKTNSPENTNHLPMVSSTNRDQKTGLPEIRWMLMHLLH
jgi:hypothetical protein